MTVWNEKKSEHLPHNFFVPLALGSASRLFWAYNLSCKCQVIHPSRAAGNDIMTMLIGCRKWQEHVTNDYTELCHLSASPFHASKNWQNIYSIFWMDIVVNFFLLKCRKLRSKDKENRVYLFFNRGSLLLLHCCSLQV